MPASRGVPNLLVSLLACVALSSITFARLQTLSFPTTRYGADTIDCQQVSRIIFLGFFPCPPKGDLNGDLPASEKLKRCDLLAEVAAQLAVDRLNSGTVLPAAAELALYPIYVPDSEDATVSCGI